MQSGKQLSDYCTQYYSVARLQEQLHTQLSPITACSKPRLISGQNAPKRPHCRRHRDRPIHLAHIMQDKGERCKESPVYQFSIPLQLGTEADTDKAPP